MKEAPGRSCPLHYRYRPSDLASSTAVDCEVLYAVGGLYGNVAALQRVLELFAREVGTKRLVFNGDFHWFDIDDIDFAAIQRGVLAHDATRGNVETELAAPEGSDDATGCGCAYPDWVGDGVVERSNRILQRLRTTARRTRDACATLAALPLWRRYRVAGCRVAVVHGDAQSLAGWGFAQESLREAAQRRLAAGWFAPAQADVFASSHTCLPVFQGFDASDGAEPHNGFAPLLLNNGAAGMPNFAGQHEGLLTRIATRPFAGPQRRFGLTRGGVHLDAVAIDYDDAAWRRRFLAQWPPGTDAHLSYWARIDEGPDYPLAGALRHEPGPTTNP